MAKRKQNMNIEELRDSLLDSFMDLKSGRLKSKDAKEVTNLSGKIMMSAKIQSDYNKYMKYDKKINFLEIDEEVYMDMEDEDDEDFDDEPIKPKKRIGRPRK